MNLPTKKVPFDIYLPATAEAPAKLVETIEVEVYENFGEEFLTAASSELIERTRARHMGFLHGKDIRDLRKRLNLTQDAFAKLLDCGEKSIPRWESGRGLPSGIVNKLMRLLHDQIISPQDLMATSAPVSYSPTAHAFTHRSANIIPVDFAQRWPSARESEQWLDQNTPEQAVGE
jgi:DNA-binding transcriptional regulator YiaG